MNDVHEAMPIVNTLKNYDIRNDLPGDLTAGITVGVMLIPQGMAYALLATLPAQYGLYSSFMPIIIYAFFGTSKQLAVGPVAIVSLLVAESIEAQGIHTEEEKIAYASLLAFFVGLISALLGLARAGILANFLSHSVLVGFTAGAAMVIALSQLKHFLGFSIPRYSFPIQTLFYALEHLPDTNPTTITMGIVATLILLGLRYAKRHLTKPEPEDENATAMTPARVRNIMRRVLFYASSLGALIVVIIGTLVTDYLYSEHGYSKETLPIVGDVPQGMPAPRAPDFSNLSEIFPDLFVSSLVISILGFMESFAVADRFARSHEYEISPSHELSGLGVANLVGSFFNTYPVTGGFSRTAVNDSAGANTPVASIISALIVLMVIFLLTSTFFYMPKNVLAAIVFVAVSGLFDFTAMRVAFKVDREDFYVMMLTMLATLCLGTEIGLAVGFACSVLILLRKLAFPHTAVLGKVPGLDANACDEAVYRNVLRFPNAERPDNAVIFRVDAGLNFANRTHVLAVLFRAVSEANLIVDAEASSRPAVVLTCEGVNSIDVAGLEMLEEIQHTLFARKISLVACNVKGPVRDAIDKQNLHLQSVGHRPVLPWLHALPEEAAGGVSAEGDLVFPTSFMTGTLDQALRALRGVELVASPKKDPVSIV
ncbi:Sulfate transporter [Hondaea fermentalgiana]|uniref:Sulfate transporter n=1 Tax=Hondaea fermentalgiana TaxID=2315210 RepID=A0A2R5GHF1_9STRA|nr:Sulfate transporter [Hondaea fermentalgiana]|eukprot:GBG28063.1 Sulfate transporter [Hondaea fermentalgiana]